MSENIATNHLLPKTRFFAVHFCRRQHESNLTTVT